MQWCPSSSPLPHRRPCRPLPRWGRDTNVAAAVLGVVVVVIVVVNVIVVVVVVVVVVVDADATSGSTTAIMELGGQHTHHITLLTKGRLA